MNKITLLSSILLAFALISCGNKNTDEKMKYSDHKSETKELIDSNHQRVSVEKDIINKYIERHNLDMTETQTGLRYMITQQSDGQEIVYGNEVEFKYRISLLNGDVIYTSDEYGLRTMQIDKNQEESGLNEGLKLMKVGEKATFIIPSHLAYSVVGDSQKIAPYSILIYEIEVTGIKNNNQEEVII